MKRALLLLLLCACHSKDITNAEPVPSATESAGTMIIAHEALDAALPSCSVHLVSNAFVPGHAVPTGKVRVEGDYTRNLAKVEVDRGAAAGHPSEVAWSGTFKGPRGAFLQMLERRVCTQSRVYALEPEGNKDPTKGPVVLDVWELAPDEKADVQNLCNGETRAPGADAGTSDLRDHAVMTWAEDVITTLKWDAWRRSFARERGEVAMAKGNPSALFHRRGTELEAAARAMGFACPTAAEWKKR
jgi:hypothetical protein